MKTNNRLLIVPLFISLGLLAACGKEKAPACGCSDHGAEAAHMPAPTSTAIPSGLEGIFVDQAPAGAQPVAKAIANAKAGDRIVVKGLIMGSKTPFTEGRAAFQLGDPAVITPCNAKPGDDCSTPWDTCCDAPEIRRTAVATIQVADAQGKVLRTGLRGVNGLKELSPVTIEGIAAPGSGNGILILNAQHIKIGD